CIKSKYLNGLMGAKPFTLCREPYRLAESRSRGIGGIRNVILSSIVGNGGLLRMRAEDEAGISPGGDDHNRYWYVVHCRPLKEAYAATVLRDNMGLVTYLPQVTRRLSAGGGKRGNGAEARPVVFFPGYLFVQANLREVKLSSINSAPGVLRLLQLGGEPRPLPAEVIEALRRRI